MSVSECARVYEGIKQRGKTHKRTLRVGCLHRVSGYLTEDPHRSPSPTEHQQVSTDVERVRACVLVCAAMNEPRVRGCQAFPPRFTSAAPSTCSRASATVMAALTTSHRQLGNFSVFKC